MFPNKMIFSIHHLVRERNPDVSMSVKQIPTWHDTSLK